MNISSNVSSIIANQGFASANANNIANVNTDGFIPTNTTIGNEGNSVTANFQKADDNGSVQSQTNLTKEITDQVSIENINSAQVATIRTQDEMFGTLLDILA